MKVTKEFLDNEIQVLDQNLAQLRGKIQHVEGMKSALAQVREYLDRPEPVVGDEAESEE